MGNGSTFNADSMPRVPTNVFFVNPGDSEYDTVIAMQKAIAELRIHISYMGTQADLQELRADLNKSMREFQEQCSSQLRSILLTLWVAMFGAFVAFIVAIIPWDRIFG